MTDFQTFAAVFALQNFSTKFKILKKNHFKQKCNGFVTVEIRTFHSWKSWIKCCRQVHQQHQIRIGSGLIVDVRPNLDCHSSPQICVYLIFTRWFIAVADFWLVIFYSSILNVVFTRDCHCRNFGWTLRERSFFLLTKKSLNISTTYLWYTTLTIWHTMFCKNAFWSFMLYDIPIYFDCRTRKKVER